MGPPPRVARGCANTVPADDAATKPLLKPSASYEPSSTRTYLVPPVGLEPTLDGF